MFVVIYIRSVSCATIFFRHPFSICYSSLWTTKKKRFYRLSYQKHDPYLVCNTNTLNCELCTLIITRWFTIKVLLTIINMHWKYREWREKIKIFRSNHDRDPFNNKCRKLSQTNLYTGCECKECYCTLVYFFSIPCQRTELPVSTGLRWKCAERSLLAIVFLCTICIYIYWN